MVDAVIRFLITIVVIAILVFLTIWVLTSVGIVIPATVLLGLKILAVLIVILIAWRFFGGYVGGWWWGPPRP